MYSIVQDKNRILTFDFLKGLGIILVVLGHITRNHNLFNCIFVFHMPLFFFISGMLYKEKERFVYKQFKSLMLPYFIFSILSFLYWYFIELKFRTKQEGTSTFEQLTNIVYPMNMDGSYEFNAVLWFLPCLFITSLSYHLFRCITSKTTYTLILLGVIVLLASLIKLKIPLYISELFCALPFYICGVLFNKYKNRWSSTHKMNRIIIGLVILLMVFSIVIFCSIRNDMKNGLYSHGYVAFFIIAISVILGLYGIVANIQRANMLQWFGINSLCIMLIHEPIKRIIIKLYSMLISSDVDIVRESWVHSIIMLIIIIAIVSVFTILINKYARFVLGK